MDERDLLELIQVKNITAAIKFNFILKKIYELVCYVKARRLVTLQWFQQSIL